MSPALSAALKSFEGGDPAQAVALLGPLLDQESDPRFALLLGEACQRCGEDDLLLRTADRLNAIDPALIRPLIWKGDVYARRGDDRRALQYYTTALARAESSPQAPSLLAALKRVDAQVTVLQDKLMAHLSAYLNDHGVGPTQRSPRIAKSLALMSGKSQAVPSIQKPTVHFLPNLPQHAWYERAEFEWAAALETQTEAIRDELLGVLADEAAFAPYIEGDVHGPARDYQGLLNNPAWSAFYLWRDGQPVVENIARCPATAAALRAVPHPIIKGRSPTAMFSLLRPRTRIPPHHGMLNARLIAHLPLIVPPGCAMRVGQETRPWREGELTLFDDSVEHEAWNESDETRVVLLFDVIRPELTEGEQRAVDLIFRAVDAYGAIGDCQ
jgi:aspartate beta-hydroxylase